MRARKEDVLRLIGGALRRHRLALGLTQGELADRAGVKRQMIGGYEAGRHWPTLPNLLDLLDGLVIDLASFLVDAGVYEPAADGQPTDAPAGGEGAA